jgi:hypothetical protein
VQLGPVHRTSHAQAQQLLIHWLRQVVEGSAADPFDRAARRAIAGDQDHRHVRRGLDQLLA